MFKMKPLIGIKLQLRDRKSEGKGLLERRCNRLASLVISKPFLTNKAAMDFNNCMRYEKNKREEGSKKR